MNQKIIVALAVGALAYFIYRFASERNQVNVNLPDPGMPISSQTFPGVNPQKVYDFAYAVSVAEGFWETGSLPQRINNPGDLELGDRGSGTEANKTIFGSVFSGWEALYNEVWLILSGRSPYYQTSQTLEVIGRTYSGGDDNWSINVSNVLGVPPSTVLADWLST